MSKKSIYSEPATMIRGQALAPSRVPAGREAGPKTAAFLRSCKSAPALTRKPNHGLS